jgi:hypothetical protein
VASSRLYTAPLKVESGYTVAIAGLDEAFNSKEGTGLPVLSKIPLLGYAFKNTQREQSKKTLLMFITPTVLDNDTPGVTEAPVSTMPVRKEDPRVPAPQIYADGTLVGGVDKLPQAILWADKQERYLGRLITEQRNNATTVKDIALLRRVITALQNYIIAVEESHPDMADQLTAHKDNLSRVRSRTWQLKCENWRNLPSDFLGH